MDLENTYDAQDEPSAFLEGWEDTDDPPISQDSGNSGESGEPDDGPVESEESDDSAPMAPPPIESLPQAPPPPPPGGLPLPSAGGGMPLGAGTVPELSPADLRMKADLRNFMQSFPEAANDPWSIPKEVWNMARSAGSLTSAYRAWSQALRRNADNAARSAGSMRSAGSGSGPVDPFLEGWNE